MIQRCSWGLMLLVLAVHTAAAAELRWQFRQGQVLKYGLQHREVRTVAIGDQKAETTTTSEYEWQWTVQEVNAQGVATLEHKFTALRVESTGKDFSFRYDSGQANPSQDDYEKKLIHLYDQLRFGEYQVQLRPDGQVVGVRGFDKLLGEIGADPAVLDFHALNLHDGSFAWYLQQALGVLPAKAPAPGEKWERTVDAKVSGFGQLTGKTEYVLAKSPEVKFTGAQALEMETRWLNNPLRGTLAITKSAGTVRFDPKARAVQGSRVEITMAGELRFGNENKPARMKVRLEHTLELQLKP